MRTSSRLFENWYVVYAAPMPHKYNKRLLELARSTESRLKKLPGLMRKEFRAGSDRQLAALTKVERAIEIVAREMQLQREHFEKSAEV